MERFKVICLTAVAVLAIGLTAGCGKKDETVNAPPPAGPEARPDAVQVNKAATPGNPGAAAPSDSQVK